jgi:type I restriction enzyme S subunit
MSEKNLPNGWKTVKLGEVGTFKTSSVDKLLHNDEIPIKLLNYMDVYKRHYIRQTDIFQDITATNKEIETFNIKKGDVFFTPSSETRGDIGHSAVALDDLNGVLYSYHLVRFRPNENIFDIGYLGYCFRTEQIYKELQIRAQGITRYTLSIGAFNDIIALIPPLPIQQRIATILSKADEEARLHKEIIKKLEERNKGLSQKLLSGEIDLTSFNL